MCSTPEIRIPTILVCAFMRRVRRRGRGVKLAPCTFFLREKNIILKCPHHIYFVFLMNNIFLNNVKIFFHI